MFLRCCVVDGYCSKCVHLAVQRRSKARVWRIAGLHTVVRAPSALFHLPLPMFYTCSLRGGSFCSTASGPPCPICLLSDVLATQPASSTLTPRLLQLRIRRLAKRPSFISLSSVDVKLVAAMDQARAVERVRTSIDCLVLAIDDLVGSYVVLCSRHPGNQVQRRPRRGSCTAPTCVDDLLSSLTP